MWQYNPALLANHWTTHSTPRDQCVGFYAVSQFWTYSLLMYHPFEVQRSSLLKVHLLMINKRHSGSGEADQIFKWILAAIRAHVRDKTDTKKLCEEMSTLTHTGRNVCLIKCISMATKCNLKHRQSWHECLSETAKQQFIFSTTCNHFGMID